MSRHTIAIVATEQKPILPILKFPGLKECLITSDIKSALKHVNSTLSQKGKINILNSHPKTNDEQDIEELQIEVAVHEPRLALDGGLDGYDIYKRIIQDAHKYLKIVTLHGDGIYSEEIKTVKDAMEDAGLFTYVWGKIDEYYVSGFALAVDDAVQILDYVHEDSNIEFLPDYVP